MALNEWTNKVVSIITNDGRNIIGILKGHDQTINVILDGSHERIFSATCPTEQVVLGLYLVRGDNIAIIGLLDEEKDADFDLRGVMADPLKVLMH